MFLGKSNDNQILTSLNRWGNSIGQLAAELEGEVNGTWVGDPVEWLHSNFWIPELYGPIRLYPYQQAVLREAYRTDDKGNFVYKYVVWSDIKKSGKSTIAAAVALHRSQFLKWGAIKIVANDLSQARGRVAYYFDRALQLSPFFMKGDNYRTRGNTWLFNETNTSVEALPIDPTGEAGGGDDLIIWSELWGASSKAQQLMWVEMAPSPLKTNSQVWVETYAGHIGEAPILEELYERGQAGQRLDLSTDDVDLSWLDVFKNKDMLVMWNTERGHLPWQTKEYYESEATRIIPSEFDRIHGNLWTSSTSQFVAAEWWDSCQGEMIEFRKRKPMILGVDAGISSDNFAVVGLSRQDGLDYIRYSRAWEAEPGESIDFIGTVNDPGPEREIVRLCYKYRVIEVRYDPYQLHDMMTRLLRGVAIDKDGHLIDPGNPHYLLSVNGRMVYLMQAELVEHNGQYYSPEDQSLSEPLEPVPSHRILKIKTVEFKQGAQRLIADKQLQDKIKNGTIVHDGDSLLGEHIKNANAKAGNTSGLRLIKKSANKKIDLAVALSEAAFDEPEKKKKGGKSPVIAQRKAKGWT